MREQNVSESSNYDIIDAWLKSRRNKFLMNTLVRLFYCI